MKVTDIKQQIDFQVDSLFQAGYDIGWNSVIEEIELHADREWNLGNKVTSEIISKLAKEMRDGGWND